MGRDWSPDDREPEVSGPSRAGGSTPPPPREDDWRARLEAGLAPPGGERFLVVRWHERIVTVSPSEQGTLRTLSAYRTIAAHRTSRRIAITAIARGLTARCDDSCGMGGSAPQLRPAATVAVRRPC